MPEEIKPTSDMFSLNLGEANAAIIQKTLNMTDPVLQGSLMVKDPGSVMASVMATSGWFNLDKTDV